MIDIFLIFGQLYPFAEVVLLTLMEYKREGDGSGEEEPAAGSEKETPENPEDAGTGQDKLYWYRFTGQIKIQDNIKSNLILIRGESSSRNCSSLLSWIYYHSFCLLPK